MQKTAKILQHGCVINTRFNGQTAWSLLRKAECFDIRIVSGIDATTAEKMRLTPMQSLSRAFAKIDKNANGYILPFGAKFLPVSDRGSVI
jgi:hypothetical protein